MGSRSKQHQGSEVDLTPSPHAVGGPLARSPFGLLDEADGLHVAAVERGLHEPHTRLDVLINLLVGDHQDPPWIA